LADTLAGRVYLTMLLGARQGPVGLPLPVILFSEPRSTNTAGCCP
jgi:hypothetical protein